MSNVQSSDIRCNQLYVCTHRKNNPCFSSSCLFYFSSVSKRRLSPAQSVFGCTVVKKLTHKTMQAGNSTVSVAAGGSVSVSINPNIYHPGPFQSYLAKVPAGQDINTWDPTTAVWFRIYAEQPTFGSQLTWPSNGE